jgi:hypothetical protein
MAAAAAVCSASCCAGCACRQLATGKCGGRPLLTGEQQQVVAAAHESAAQRHLYYVECVWRWMMMVVAELEGWTLVLGVV